MFRRNDNWNQYFPASGDDPEGKLGVYADFVDTARPVE